MWTFHNAKGTYGFWQSNFKTALNIQYLETLKYICAMNLKRKGTLWGKRSRKLKFFITNPAQLDRSNWTVDTYCVLHRTNVITYQVSNRFMCFVFCFYWLINLKICLITQSSDNYAVLFKDFWWRGLDNGRRNLTLCKLYI